MEVLEITASQLGAVQSALKLLKLHYWQVVIDTNPLNKIKRRITISAIRPIDLTVSGNELNQILGAIRHAAH